MEKAGKCDTNICLFAQAASDISPVSSCGYNEVGFVNGDVLEVVSVPTPKSLVRAFDDATSHIEMTGSVDYVALEALLAQLPATFEVAWKKRRPWYRRAWDALKNSVKL